MKKIKITMFISILIFALSSVASVAYGADIYIGSKSEIDASNAADGYVKVRYLKETTKKLKVIIEKDSVQYTYNLNNNGKYDAYPFQLGDGKYKVKVFENISDNKYASMQTVDIDVKLKDQNAPYLVATQMINFTPESEVSKKAQELTENKENDLQKVEAIYDYVVSNISYDHEKAKTVKSDYLPDVDEILKSNKGICYDYSSLLAAMLRSNSIPTKLVTGYSQNLNAFHAWNEVYTPETGWIALDKVYFDGKDWKLMDPTVASGAKNSTQAMDYINKLIDRQYYTKKFEY